jgi:hypothetical protein
VSLALPWVWKGHRAPQETLLKQSPFRLEDNHVQSILSGFFLNNSIALGLSDNLSQLILSEFSLKISIAFVETPLRGFSCSSVGLEGAQGSAGDPALAKPLQI